MLLDSILSGFDQHQGRDREASLGAKFLESIIFLLVLFCPLLLHQRAVVGGLRDGLRDGAGVGQSLLDDAVVQLGLAQEGVDGLAPRELGGECLQVGHGDDRGLGVGVKRVMPHLTLVGVELAGFGGMEDLQVLIMELLGSFQEPLLEELVPFGELDGVLGVEGVADYGLLAGEVDDQLGACGTLLRLPPVLVELGHYGQNLAEGTHLKLSIPY